VDQSCSTITTPLINDHPTPDPRSGEQIKEQIKEHDLAAPGPDPKGPAPLPPVMSATDPDPAQAPLLPAVTTSDPTVARFLRLLTRWSGREVTEAKARWRVDLAADVGWFLAGPLPAAVERGVDLAAEMDKIDLWTEGQHRGPRHRPGWSAGGWKNGIAGWLKRARATAPTNDDPSAEAWSKLCAGIQAQGPAIARRAPADVLAGADACGGINHLARLGAFDLARLQPTFRSAFLEARRAQSRHPAAASRPVARDHGG
jgi:hypothetical protein